MVIQIPGLTTGQSDTAKTRQNETIVDTKKTIEETGTKTANEDDVVELSTRAQVLSNANSKMASLPDIDQEKVDRIRTAIENGDYQIDYDKLATTFRRFESGL